MKNKKSLGQHWLKDRETLMRIAREAVGSLEVPLVLEIGAGLGTLTSALFKFFDEVWAVEYDEDLAKKLSAQFPGKNLRVFNEDFLQFDLDKMPKGYVIAGNIPYYITGKIVRRILEAKNAPERAVLLVQKEVAERMAGESSGKQSLLGLACAVYANVRLREVVPAEMFTPPPKIDSQVVILEILDEPRVPEQDLGDFWRMAHAGFSSPRKKVAGNIAGFFNVDKTKMREILEGFGISADARAEDLTLANWTRLLYYRVNG